MQQSGRTQSLASKTLVALCAAVLPALAVAIFLGSVLVTSVGEAEREFERASGAARRLTEIRVLFAREHGIIARLPAELDPKRIDAYEHELADIDRGIFRELSALAASGAIVSRHLMDQLQSSRRALREVTGRLLTATRSVAQATARERVRGWEARSQVKAALLDSVTADVRAGVERTRSRLRASSQQAWHVTALALLAAAASVLAGIWLMRSHFVRPVTALTEHVRRISATHDLDLQHDSPVLDRHDEIGALARSFDMMMAELSAGRRRMMASSETEVRIQYERLDAAINSMPVGLCMFDPDMKLIVANRRYAELYGLRHEEMQPGLPLRTVLERRAHICAPEDAADFVARRLEVAKCREPYYVTHVLGDGRIVAITHHPLAGGGSIAVHEDITERSKAEERVAYLAHHDTLTSLPNRVRFREALHDALAEEGRSLAVLCLDLDQFKSVNDTLGHPVGDKLLCAIAERLHGCLGPGDLAARLGGDEFAIMQTDGAQPVAATALAACIVRELGEPYEIDGHQIVTGVSIGIAVAPTDGREADQLLRNADLTLHRAKEEGRGVYRFFEPAMDARMQTRRALELDLRKAVAQGEFELVYQPLVRLADNEISGFEALLRWRHPQRGMISPAEFVPLAEEIGLIGHLGAWVLRTACTEAAKWPRGLKVAVNLSPVQLMKDTVLLDVVAALGASGLSARRLELEITESVLLQETEATLSILNQLRDLGVGIAMDDFGTGYSSLAYLRKFHFDKVKIDRSFIQELLDKPDAIAIIRAVVGLGHAFGIVTTAEGVETAEQLEAVRREGCTEAQGYLISVPRPAHEIPTLLREPPLKARSIR